MQLALTSADATFRQMEAYAKALRDTIERAPGVQQADVWGAPPAEVRVAADLDRLAAYRLPLTAVADASAARGRRYADRRGGSWRAALQCAGIRLVQQSR